MHNTRRLLAEPFSIEPLRELLASLQKARAVVALMPKRYFRKFGFDPAQPRDEDGRWTASGASDGKSLIQDVAYQGDFHDAVKKQWLDYLNKTGGICVDEVRLTLAPVTARLDILCQTAIRGIYVGFEIKTGADPTLTPQQMIVYPHAIGGAGVRSPDAKIGALGLLPDVELPPIPILFIYAEKPGVDYRFFAPKLEPLEKKLGVSSGRELTQYPDTLLLADS
ncbi:hypothetical protein [Methylocapsa sp. S129]|uniref:hypothetical protein n=1 Tax=Methylocapsa sp. S129 TaxID=1641869 RepID=UPI00131BF926|nr:hypothetical protein [Methylocapsa sp. S129]